MGNIFEYVGLRHLLERPLRTILTVLGVALGVALFISIQMINHSTLHSFQDNIEALGGKSTLTVTAGETGFPEEKYDLIRHFPGVKTAVPMVESHGFYQAGGRSESLVFLGVDMLKEQGVRTYTTSENEILDDPLIFLNQPDSVVMSNSFAKAHGLALNSKFEISTSQGKKTLVVRGLLTPQGPAAAYGGDLAIMDIDGARATFGKIGKLDRIDIVTEKNQDIDKLALALEKTLGPGYSAERPQAQQENMRRLVRSYQLMLSFFSTLALLVGLFLVSNSVSISVAERRREIGTLRALGGTRLNILILFISESLVLGFIGGALGLVFGQGLARFLIGMVGKSMSTQYLIPIHGGKLIFGQGEILLGLVMGTGASGLAALYPAWKATTIQPLEAMKKTELDSSKADLTLWVQRSFWTGLGLLVFLSISSPLKWGEKFELIEHLNSIACLLGPALLAPVIVTSLIALKKRLIRSSNPVSLLATENLLRQVRRTQSNVATLVVGLMLVIMLSSSNASFKHTIVEWFSRVLHSDILVSSFGSLISYQTQPLDESVGLELEKTPGVFMGPKRGAYGVRFIHFKYQGHQLGLKAYDEPNPEDGQFSFDVQDRPTLPAMHELFHSPDLTVMVSNSFVLHYGKKTGDTLTVDTPTGSQTFRIVGVIVDFASPEGVFYINRAKFKTLWKDSLVDAFGIKAMPGVDPEKLRHLIDSDFGPQRGLMTLSNLEMKQQLIKSIDDSFAYTKAIEAASLLVALLGLLNTFSISIMERTRELGMLRAVGMSKVQLFSMLIRECLIQGILGALVAVGLGAYIAWLWINNSLSHVLGWIVHFSFPLSTVLATLGLGIGVTVLAALYPAWKATQIEIREALDYE